MANIDFIIVGQGIAGTVLSYLLVKGGYSVHVFGSSSAKDASRVAAGVFNPMVFKRMITSWKAPELLPVAREFYKELEEATKSSFYQEMPLYKVINHEEEKDFWEKQSQKEDLKPYLDEVVSSRQISPQLLAESGLGKVNYSGRVDVNAMLDSYREWLEEKHFFTNGEFNFSELDTKNHKYGNTSYKKIIFCEGNHVMNNPYFSWLPFKLTKGEVLTIYAPKLKLNEMVKKNIFILPLGDDKYQVGATYEWKDLSYEVTEAARKSLTIKLENLIESPFEIIDQKAGIRPTVKDRRMIIGPHPTIDKMYVFNGLGTRGIMMAPYFAMHFIDYLEQKIETLNEEIDIKRFLLEYEAENNVSGE